MNKPNKPTRSDRNRQAISGVKKHLANAPPIVVDGVTRTPADIEAILQGSIDAADVTTAASAAFHKAVAAERAVHATGDVLYRGMRTVLLQQYATAPDTLADFGISPPRRQTPDAATVAEAVTRRAATRAARHTMGKRQKAGIKGTVPSTSPTTAPTPATQTTQVK